MLIVGAVQKLVQPTRPVHFGVQWARSCLSPRGLSPFTYPAFFFGAISSLELITCLLSTCSVLNRTDAVQPDYCELKYTEYSSHLPSTTQ